MYTLKSTFVHNSINYYPPYKLLFKLQCFIINYHRQTSRAQGILSHMKHIQSILSSEFKKKKEYFRYGRSVII